MDGASMGEAVNQDLEALAGFALEDGRLLIDHVIWSVPGKRVSPSKRASARLSITGIHWAPHCLERLAVRVRRRRQVSLNSGGDSLYLPATVSVPAPNAWLFTCDVDAGSVCFKVCKEVISISVDFNAARLSRSFSLHPPVMTPTVKISAFPAASVRKACLLNQELAKQKIQ